MRKLAFVFAVSCVGVCGFVPAAMGESRPNVLLLVADDLGLEPELDSAVRTPNLDRLRATSLVLGSHYAAAPTCSPSRAAILTGRYPQRFGLRKGFGLRSERGLPRGTPTIATDLSASGYRTMFIGKWHLGNLRDYSPTSFGFERFLGLGHSSGTDYESAELFDSVEGLIRLEGHLTEALGRRVVQWLRSPREGSPFFLMVSFLAPHRPLQPMARWASQYPDTPSGRFSALVSGLDEVVGEIAAELREKGLQDETLIVFVSDNGAHASDSPSANSGLRGGKATYYEGGIRVPAWISWPARIKPGRWPGTTSHMDFRPTIGQLLGVAGWHQTDGIPLFSPTGKSAPSAERTLHWRGFDNESLRAEFAVLEGGTKLIGSESRGFELYDLRADPHELRNLASTPRGKATAERLAEMHHWWHLEVAAVAPNEARGAGQSFIAGRDGAIALAARTCLTDPGRLAHVPGSWTLRSSSEDLVFEAFGKSWRVRLSGDRSSCSFVGFTYDNAGSRREELPGLLRFYVAGDEVAEFRLPGPLAAAQGEPVRYDRLQPLREGTWLWHGALSRDEHRMLAEKDAGKPANAGG